MMKLVNDEFFRQQVPTFTKYRFDIARWTSLASESWDKCCTRLPGGPFAVTFF